MSYRIEEGPISMEFLNMKSFWHLWTAHWITVENLGCIFRRWDLVTQEISGAAWTGVAC